MAFWDRFRKKTVALNDVLALVFPFGSSGKNKLSNSTEAIFNSHLIYRAIASVSQRIGALPWHIVKGDKINERAEKSFVNSNSDFTITEIFEKTSAFQCLSGYHVWYVENKIITPIDSNLVRIERNQMGQYRVTPLWKYNANLIQENFVIFPNFTPFNSLLGISELQTCIDVANLGENAITLTNNIMVNGGMLQGILHTTQDITKEQAEEAQRKFEEKYSGIDKTGKIMVAGKGLEWQKVGISPSDFSALELMKVTLEGVSIAFGVPKIFLMNTESVDYANSKTQERIFYQITVKPKADRLADRINRFVLPLLNLDGYEFYFDWSAVEVLQPDKLLQAQIDEYEIRSGKTLINEARIRDNQPATDYGWSWWNSVMLSPLGTYIPPEEAKHTEDLDIKLKRFIEIRTKQSREEAIWKDLVARTEPQEKRIIKELEEYFNKQKKEVVNKVREQLKSVKGLNPEDFIPDSDIVKLSKMLKPFIIAFMQQSGDATLARIGTTVDFNLQLPEIMKWIEWKLNKSALEITDVTRTDVIQRLQEGIDNGEGIDKLAKRIEDLFEETYKNRIQTIARTEVISANNKASLEAASQAGMTTKTWLTAMDERTRPWHAEANGQEVGIDEKFTVNGEELDEPGDPSASPENIINCRCTLIFGGE